MKIYFCFIFLFFPILIHAQNPAKVAPAGANKKAIKLTRADTVAASIIRRMTLASLSVGFVDYYRHNIALPSGFQQNNTTGFAPVYGRIEYGVSNAISIAALFSYDVFYDNFSPLFNIPYGNNFKLSYTDKVKIFSAGVATYYHFGKFIKVKKLDAFCGIGLVLNNIQHNAAPQGDSTAVTITHTVSPYLKAGPGIISMEGVVSLQRWAMTGKASLP